LTAENICSGLNGIFVVNDAEASLKWHLALNQPFAIRADTSDYCYGEGGGEVLTSNATLV
jgi:hypothetical protein